jgi:hypothetical protein
MDEISILNKLKNLFINGWLFKYFCNHYIHFSPTGTFPLATCLAFPYFLTSTAFSVAHISTWH